MLFWIDKSLADALDDNGSYLLASDAIDRIVKSQIIGNHIYFSDPSTLKRLIKNKHIEQRVKQHINMVLQSYSQKKAYTKFKKYVEICWGKNIHEIIKDDEKSTIRISADVFMNSRIHERTLLLCENNNDILFYDKLTYIFMVENNLSYGFKINYDPINGGGNNISGQYDLFQSENQKLCICILDSDRRYKNSGLGETARNLKNVHKKNIRNGVPKGFCDFEIIDARETENLIPSTLIYTVVEGEPNRRRFADWCKKLEEKGSEARFYIDVKDGINFRNIVNKGSVGLINYWEKELRQWLHNCHFLVSHQCRDKCDCFVVPGMGDNVLENVIKILSKMSIQKMAEIFRRDKELQNKVLIIGQKIFYWVVNVPPAYTY